MGDQVKARAERTVKEHVAWDGPSAYKEPACSVCGRNWFHIAWPCEPLLLARDVLGLLDQARDCVTMQGKLLDENARLREALRDATRQADNAALPSSLKIL